MIDLFKSSDLRKVTAGYDTIFVNPGWLKFGNPTKTTKRTDGFERETMRKRVARAAQLTPLSV